MKNTKEHCEHPLPNKISQDEIEVSVDRTTAHLEKAEIQIQTIFKRAPDAVVVINENGIITKWNPKAEIIFGWEANEVIGKYLHEIIIPKQHHKRYQLGMKHILKSSEGTILNKPIEIPALRKNDSEFQTELNISHFEFQDENYFIGFIKDISERKLAEQKIKESEERFLKIFDSNPIAMTLSEIGTNKIVYANKLFHSSFGYTAEEVIGHTSDELNLMSVNERERLTSISLEYLKENRTITELRALSVDEKEKILIQLKPMKGFEIEYTRKNGSLFYAFITYETIELEGGKYTITSYQDITERKKIEARMKEKSEELIQTNKELVFQIEEKEKRDAELVCVNTDLKEKEELIAHKETILAILSHDLRSPLTGIIGTAEFLQSNLDEMNIEEIKEMLGLLYESSKKELNMLDYLVEWARIKYASQGFTPEKIELREYANTVFDLLHESATKNEMTLHNGIESGTTVFADGKMVLSILQNLLTNAIKHSHPCETITVFAERKEDKIVVQIKDNGIGMCKKTQGKLFTPQMDTLSEERKENKGAGIGLLLVKGFLEKNGGEIWVESEEGKGSTFYFTLPIDSQAK